MNTPEENGQVTAAKEAPDQEGSEKIVTKMKRSEKAVKHYQWFILRLLVFLFVLWVLFFKIVGLTHMPNGDMYPRVDAGDLLLFYRLDKDPKAQDIIVMEKSTPEDAEKQLFVLRVVAVAGDTVDISDGERLVVNGNTLVETNIFYPPPRYQNYTNVPVTLGEGECFVLADSRNGGADSRYFGVVKKDEIEGTVITVLRRNNL